MLLAENVKSISNYFFYGCKKEQLVWVVTRGSYAETYAKKNYSHYIYAK